jgi:hypothetical protein
VADGSEAVVGITIKGVDAVRNRLRRMPAVVQAAAVDHITRAEVVPMANDMRRRASGYGGIPAIAAQTIRVERARNGARAHAGGSGTLGGVLTKGGEYGGGKRPPVAYVTRSRRGRPYVVRRRTTKQFHPFLGQRGYWFWPTVRLDLKGVRKRIKVAVVKAANRGH